MRPHRATRSLAAINIIVMLPLLAALAFAGCGGGGDDGAGGGNTNNGGNIGTSGAQDIGQFRKILDEGEIPAENTLDPNGFFNEHFVELPSPDCGQTLCLHPMLAVGFDWVRQEYQAALQIGINTTINAEELERPPLNLVVVVDTSGSMSDDDKMPFAKDGLHLLIDGMEEGDRLGIVAYSDGISTLAELSDALDATALHEAVDQLYAAGSTNLYSGLHTGLAMVADSFDFKRQNRVILLSDGIPTAGNTDPQEILDMAEAFVSDGIGLATVGMGLDFNVELMRSLAELGAGTFYFVEDAEAVQEVFVSELDYFLTPIAFDLTVEVRTGVDYQVGEVVGTRFWTSADFGGELTIPAVFLASRTSQHPVDPGRRGGGSAIFVQMIPNPHHEALESGRVAEVRMTYRLMGSDQTYVQMVSLDNPNAAGVIPERPYYTNPAMEKYHAMYNIFLGLREACRQAETSHNYSLWVLEQLQANASEWNRMVEDLDIGADIDLIEQFMDNLLELGAVPVDPYSYQDPCYEGCNEGVYNGPFGCAMTRSPSGSAPWIPLALALLCLGAGLMRRKRNG